MSTNSATAFAGPMDPEDSVDYVGELDLLLEAGETIQAGFTVSPTTESAALGFEIDTGAKLPVLETGDQKVLFWAKVNVLNQADAVFSDDGVQCEVEITVTTTDTRVYQRTFLVTVKQL
jgi:hypothetical protein